MIVPFERVASSQASGPLMRNRAVRRSTSLTLALVACVVVLMPLTAANAQGGLRDRISDLFIFGAGQSPLFLAGSGDPSNPISLQAHGLHFIPSSSAENASLIAFITDALGASGRANRRLP